MADPAADTARLMAGNMRALTNLFNWLSRCADEARCSGLPPVSAHPPISSPAAAESVSLQMQHGGQR
jgi:hypothetical protein